MFIVHLYISFSEMTIKVLCAFLIGLLIFIVLYKDSLYVRY